MKKSPKYLTMLLLIIFGLSSCSNDDDNSEAVVPNSRTKLRHIIVDAFI